MSTRSVILVNSRYIEREWDSGKVTDTTVPIARAYRHCDGYPEGFGYDICIALAKCSVLEFVDNRNWAQHFIWNLFSMGMELDMEPPAGEHQFAHGDLEYVYRVTGEQDYTGGRERRGDPMEDVTVEVFATHYSDELEPDYSNLDGYERLFAGSWTEMARWLSSKRGLGDAFSMGYDPRWEALPKGVSERCWNAVRKAVGECGA